MHIRWFRHLVRYGGWRLFLRVYDITNLSVKRMHMGTRGV
jgi:hypothetical protein